MAWSLQLLPSLSVHQFELWRKLVEERTGIQLTVGQKSWLEAQLCARMRSGLFDDYNDYYRFIMSGVEGHLEWSCLIDILAVKDTRFFRHRDSIELVGNYVQETIDADNDSVTVWSLGCSTGEEAYSLAMTIDTCYEKARRHPHYGITAMDISSAALKTARQGIYPARKLEPLTPTERQRYFTPLNNGDYQVTAQLRERVCFSRHNVIHARALPATRVDVIFCQNLLIYFRRWLRRDMLNALVERLKPGGLLIVGLGESGDWHHGQMQRIQDPRVHAYRRRVQQ